MLKIDSHSFGLFAILLLISPGQARASDCTYADEEISLDLFPVYSELFRDTKFEHKLCDKRAAVGGAKDQQFQKNVEANKAAAKATLILLHCQPPSVFVDGSLSFTDLIILGSVNDKCVKQNQGFWYANKYGQFQAKAICKKATCSVCQ